MAMYPLKFVPKLIEKMWGGRKIETVLHKPLPPGKSIGESWEICDFPPGVVEGSTGWVSSVVANGPLAGKSLHQIIAEFGPDLMGKIPLAQGGQFPLLIKFLDAREDLSVQVHPPREYCQKHPEANLKSESWYVLQADPGSRILKGVKPGVTRETFKEALLNGTVESQITSISAKVGQFFYLPSGTVHALGAGILAAEIQTPSDTTFRVFDFNRVDPSTGKQRKLHIEQALECIDFSGVESPSQRSHVGGFFGTVSRLVTSEYFRIEKVRFSEGVHEPIPYDQPVVWIVVEGKGELTVKGMKEPVAFSPGETLLLPAKMDQAVVHTHTDCVWLEATAGDWLT